MRVLRLLLLMLLAIIPLEVTHFSLAYGGYTKDAVVPKGVTVVLLHGLCRSPRSMRKMEKALKSEGYRVINHGYPSRTATIEALSFEVFKALEPQIKHEQTVHFVTHSMGGIILRQYLETRNLPNLGNTVMLAPPSRGSEIIDKLGRFSLFKRINGPAGNQLGTDAVSLPLKLKPPLFKLGVIAGDRSVNPILSMLIPGPDDGKVSVVRVKSSGLSHYAQYHVTHPFMARNAKVIADTKHFLEHGSFKQKEDSHD